MTEVKRASFPDQNTNPNATVPAPLKLTGHQTIGGIDGIVLSTGMGGLVPRLLQRQLEL